MESKKAQGLSINTIILIILGVLVLVALIYGFTKGWAGIQQWIAPSNNLAEIKSQCDVACSTDNKFNYCYEKREVRVDKTTIKDTSCYVIAKMRQEYGISQCPALDTQCGIYAYKTEEANNPLKAYCCLNNRVIENKKVWVIDNRDDKISTYLSLAEEACTNSMCD